MPNAARQRLLRSQPDGQLTFGAELDDALYPPEPRHPDDPHAQDAFAALAERVRPHFAPADDPWADSPYAWVKRLPSVSRGRAGTAIVEQWARSQGHDVVRARGHDHDLNIGSERVKVKMSTLWDTGEYTFQGVRDGAYDSLTLLGVSPQIAHLWIVPRHTALENTARAGWITVTPTRIPAWLAGLGGEPARAARVADVRWALRDSDKLGPTLTP